MHVRSMAFGGRVGAWFGVGVALVMLAAVACSTTVDPPVDAGGDPADAPVGSPTCMVGTAKAPGTACGCNEECGSGFCADGVCCASACTDTCKACNVPGELGKCVAVPAGSKPTNPAECSAEAPETCGRDGTCDGAGRCRLHPNDTVCGKGTCQDGLVAGRKTCRAGACVDDPLDCGVYNCDPATGACFAQCQNESQCRAGRKCEGGSCGKKGLGMPCDATKNECESNFCVDGVCCATKCEGGCQTCALDGKKGQCAPVPKGANDPHGVCKPDPMDPCGISGACNGLGACAKTSAGTMCRPSVCASATWVPASTCDGSGTCKVGTALPCNPYMCGADACLRECKVDGDCVAPHTCVNGSCGGFGLGQACTKADDCLSKNCVDGVCCESACTGKCRTCNSPRGLGRCLAVEDGAPDPRAAAGVKDPNLVCLDQGPETCGTNGLCNGAGGCQLYKMNVVCKAEACDAATSRYSPAWTCNGTGTCTSTAARTCEPFKCSGTKCRTTCTTDDDCVAPNKCVNGSCGLLPIGQLCSSNAQCASGQCAQGVCCTTACAGSCFSCALPGTTGSCTAVPQGGIDPTGTCQDQGPGSCGNDGTCNGSGACRKYAAGTQCVAPSCANGVASAGATCNGTGSCVMGGAFECAPYKCNADGSACYSACTPTGNECATGNSCVNGRCGKKQNGGVCSAGDECMSGFCVDGVCCENACDGKCKSCAAPGAPAGTCSNVPAGQIDTNGGCVAGAPSSCGDDGTCDGSGGCRKFPSTTICRAASCPAGSSTLAQVAYCDGAGACPASATQSCGSYLCDAGKSACRTTCGSAADCVAGNQCTSINGTFICGTPKDAGQPCTTGAECKAGLFCTNGTCCTTAMCGTCQTCANPTGTCAAVAAGTTDARCASPAENPCARNGVCGAGGQCAPTPAGTACGGTCNGNNLVSKTCDGAGMCTGTGTTTSCGNYVCRNNACVTRCQSNIDCAVGTCRGSSGQCK